MHLSWEQHMKGGVYPSHFASLSFPDLKRLPINCWVDRESFPDWDQTHDLQATYCTKTESL